MRILLDTNVIIDWFSGGPSQKILEGYLRQDAILVYVPFISVIEFLIKAPPKSESLFSKAVEANEWTVLYVDSTEIIKTVVAIRREANLKLPDAIIIGLAKANGLTLLTRDRDMKMRGGKFCRVHYVES